MISAEISPRKISSELESHDSSTRAETRHEALRLKVPTDPGMFPPSPTPPPLALSRITACSTSENVSAVEEYRICTVQGMTEAEEDKLLALKDFMLKSNKAKASVGEQSQLGEAVHAGAIDLSALGLSGRQVDLVKARPEAEDKRGKNSASGWISAGIQKVPGPSPDPLPGSCSEEAHQAGLHHERGVEEHVRLSGASRRPERHGNRNHGNQASATTRRLIRPTVCAGERRARPHQEERRGPAGAHAAVAGHWPRLPASHQHLQGGASAAGAAEAGAVQRRAHGQADDGERRVGEPAATAR